MRTILWFALVCAQIIACVVPLKGSESSALEKKERGGGNELMEYGAYIKNCGTRPCFLIITINNDQKIMARLKMGEKIVLAHQVPAVGGKMPKFLFEYFERDKLTVNENTSSILNIMEDGSASYVGGDTVIAPIIPLAAKEVMRITTLQLLRVGVQYSFDK